MMKVVLYDNRKDSATHGEVNEFFMGEHNPILLQTYLLMYTGFRAHKRGRGDYNQLFYRATMKSIHLMNTVFRLIQKNTLRLEEGQ